MSAQTVSKLTRDLDETVRQFHQARLSDEYVYLFLNGGEPAGTAANESVDRIIYSIFQRFNLECKTGTLNLFT